MTTSIAIRVLARALAYEGRFDRARAAFHRLRTGVLDEALSFEEKEALGILLFDASPYYRGAELFPWEGPWWGRDLPAAPARVLVGGAGSGREVKALLERGYAVDAFEPATSHYRALRELESAGARVALGSYADLVAGGGPLARFRDTRYDAVLLGWGSLTHVLGETRRRQLFACLDDICPRGPLLASFFFSQAPPGSFGQRAPGRSEELGRRIGRALRQARGRAELPSERETNGFASYMGYAHTFRLAELQALAAGCGRSLHLETKPYAHATFAAPGDHTS